MVSRCRARCVIRWWTDSWSINPLPEKTAHVTRRRKLAASSRCNQGASTMFEQAFKNIDDALRKEAGCASELDYTEQTSWLLFLKYLDALEHQKAMEAGLEGRKYSFVLDPPYRWTSW